MKQFLALTLLVGASLVSAQATPASSGNVVLSGLNGPMGVLVGPDGSLYAVDSGMGGDMTLEVAAGPSGETMTVTIGDSARVVQRAVDGSETVLATLPSLLSEHGAAGGARLALVDGTLYLTSSEWVDVLGETRLPKMGAILKLEGGEAVEVANTFDLEVLHDYAGGEVHAHPYGLAAASDGSLWVADAGGNTLMRVNPISGEVSHVATFETVEQMNPEVGAVAPTEAVPTGLALGPDGTAYVSLFNQGMVVQVTSTGEVSPYSTGVPLLTDLHMGPDGQLYGVQIAEFGPEGPVPNSGKLLRILEGGGAETVIEGLSFPSAVAFSAAGDAYLTTNVMGAPGSGEVLEFVGLVENSQTAQ